MKFIEVNLFVKCVCAGMRARCLLFHCFVGDTLENEITAVWVDFKKYMFKWIRFGCLENVRARETKFHFLYN